MPGPVSDSYDPEWGTIAEAEEIYDSLQRVYKKVSKILGEKPPIYIKELVLANDLNTLLTAELTEQEWRIIRFAIERAYHSL